MQDSTIHHQAAIVIDEIGCNTAFTESLRSAWRSFAAFLEEDGALLLRIEDIPQDALHRFASHYRSQHACTGSLQRTLSALRMLLTRAGHRPGSLAALVAPTRRVRVRNQGNGKYAFVHQEVEVSTKPDGTGSAIDDQRPPYDQ